MDYYYFTFEEHKNEQEKIKQLRNDYRSLGLSIFESFEEYCSDKTEENEWQ